MSTRTQSSEGLYHLVELLFQWVIKSGKHRTYRLQAQHGQIIRNADDHPVINLRLHSKGDILIELEQRWYFLYRVFLISLNRASRAPGLLYSASTSSFIRHQVGSKESPRHFPAAQSVSLIRF